MFSLKEFPYPPQAGVACSIIDIKSHVGVSHVLTDMKSLIRRPAGVAWSIIDMKCIACSH